MSISLVFLLALNSLSSGTSCSDLQTSDSCLVSGCDWVETTITTCLGPAADDCSGTARIGCEAVQGCEWSAASSGYCGSPDNSTCIGSSPCGAGCKQNSASGFCSYPLPSECEKLSSQPSCEAGNNGCKWQTSGGSCEYRGLECEILDKAECSTMSGCNYLEYQAGYCSLPDSNACDGFSTSDTCESSNRGCKWFAAGGSCRSPQCDSIETQTECAANEYCEYRPAQGYCDQPQSDCGGKTPSECDAEESGCTWVPNSYDCRYPDCYGLDKETCSSPASGCFWKSAGSLCQQNYQCYLLSDTECQATNSGCEFFPTEYQCTLPNNGVCQCLSTEETCDTGSNGCMWTEWGNCVSDSGKNCQEVNGACDMESSDPSCHWKVSGLCQVNYNLVCVGNSEENPTACSIASQEAGCIWKKISDSRCETNNTLICVGNSEENPTACSTPSQEAGCKWFDGDVSGYCSTKPGLVCSKNVEGTGCSTTTEGCKWMMINHGFCAYNGFSVNCETKQDNSGCTDDSDPQCRFVVYSQAGCDLKNGLYCVGDPCKPGCSDYSDNGCSWQGSTAYCGVNNELNCVTNATYDGCTSSSSSYCVWRPGTGECHGSSVKCYDNAEKNGCDEENSDSGCQWYLHPATCILDSDNLQCGENVAETACKTSTACKWIDIPAGCGVDEGLYCVNNSANTGCKTESSDTGCVWHAATTGLCRPNDGFHCTANEGNTACSAYSTSIGCTWKSGLVKSCKDTGINPNSNKSSSSVVFVPIFGILLMFVLFL